MGGGQKPPLGLLMGIRYVLYHCTFPFPAFRFALQGFILHIMDEIYDMSKR
jgi:hypothetical protein